MDSSQLIYKILCLDTKISLQLSNMQGKAIKIEEYYLPRNKFERWKKSQEGIIWKEQRWRQQKQKCAICKEETLLSGSHIDHIKPISRYPELAVDIDNLQIACPACNTSKGNRELLDS